MYVCIYTYVRKYAKDPKEFNERNKVRVALTVQMICIINEHVYFSVMQPILSDWVTYYVYA